MPYVTERRKRVLLAVVVTNWIISTILATILGGTALDGEVTDEGQYLIRRQPNYVGTAVTETHWLVSLVYDSLTVGLTPLIIVLGVSGGRAPGERRGLGFMIFVALAIAWSLMIAHQALQRVLEYTSR